MQRFTQLYLELDRTTKSSLKKDALRRYFEEAPAEDACWALHFLTGNRFKRAITASRLRDWIAEVTNIPRWLVNESYDHVGDLAETLALLLDANNDRRSDEPLHEVVDNRIAPLVRADDDHRRAIVVDTWNAFSRDQSFVWHKLIMGAFRVGVAKKTVINALAEVAGVSEAVMAHRLSGSWKPTAVNYEALLRSEDEGDAHELAAKPYPFFLAHPLQAEPESLGDIDDWLIEWKWDGLRAQLIRRGGERTLWSRGEGLIGDQFPEILAIAEVLPDEGTVIDGEFLAWENDGPLSFNLLQRRIGRKLDAPMLFVDVPVVFMAFDLLEKNGEDIRGFRLHERRRRLAALIESLDDEHVRLSPMIGAETWDEVAHARAEARERKSEGLMIKRRDSAYGVGRTTGDWWKWKVDPYTVDCVLIYAQRGHGRRASLFTDYTFGVWDGDELVPFAKAYSGLTDEEIHEVDRRIRNTTTGRSGPVYFVKPELVFELAFEGIQSSTRHKSGIALRFPRMNRWRTDKKPEDADSIDVLRDLLRYVEGEGSAPA